MPVKRSLKLEAHSSNPSRMPRTASYSPTTGTCQMSPFPSPARAEEEPRNEPSKGKRRKFDHLNLMERKESTPKDNDEFMMILSKVEKSSDRVMEIMQNLNSIQALKGSRELENLIGVSFTCCSLKREMEKTKELMIKVMKQKLFEKKSTGLPHKAVKGKHLLKGPYGLKSGACELCVRQLLRVFHDSLMCLHLGSKKKCPYCEPQFLLLPDHI